MKKLIFITIVCAFVAVPAMADPYVRINYGNTNYQLNPGGEFTALLKDSGSGWTFDPTQYYADSTKNEITQSGYSKSFQTFCVETDEYVNNNNDYHVELSSSAWQGGVAGPEPDPISVGTAYLYNEFAKGTLTGYTYTPGSGRQTSAGQLQQMIWKLEQETGGVVNFAGLLDAEFGTFYVGGDTVQKNDALAVWMANNNGLYPVQVMRLDQSGVLKQDMLVRVPVPAAVLLGMLGFGVAGLKLRKLA